MALASKTLGGLGRTRLCPHCRAQILESASVCPGCKGHLRFDSAQLKAVEKPARVAWQVEGTLAADSLGAGTEYSVVISVRNESNKEIARHVVNVGALTGADKRTFNLSVEVTEPRNR
ncbi:MAG: hypothetical protein ABW136_09250 [Steroidobacteraceae bacterium]